MATVYVGSARSDEKGKAYGGKAGDQKNGLEVSTQAWYKHSKGWRVFRAKDPAKAKKMAEAMRIICADDNVGYDQHQRLTLYQFLETNGFNIFEIDKNVETDCSALVRVCAKYAGIDLPNFNTSSEAKALLSSGEFIEMIGTKYTDRSDWLGEGDVLNTRSKGHTAIVLNSGDKYERRAETTPVVLGVRILKEGMEGEDVAELQRYLLALGYDLGTYGANEDGVDGEYGTKTVNAVKDFQSKHGLDDDGEYGELTHEKMQEAFAVARFKVRVTGNRVNVRSAPNTATGIIQRTVGKGTVLNAVGVDSETGWFKLDDGNYISDVYSVRI